MAKKAKEETFTHGFLNQLIKSSGNELASIMDEETLSTTTEWLNTGSYALNGLISSHIDKGIPNNKIIAIAGEEHCGKTYLVLDIAKHAIENENYIVAFFDSENATEKQAVIDRDIDPKKIMYFPVDTVENFRDQVVKILNKYNETDDENKPKLLLILDSLGNLSTNKEVRDIEEGNNKEDMTRAKRIKSIFRVLSLKLAKAKIPMLITNHVYTDQGSFIPSKIMGGGSGLKYYASVILYITRSKIKDTDKTVTGIGMNIRSVKNRYCRPEISSKLYLDFEKGLHPYYGLQDNELVDKTSKGFSIGDKTISKAKLTKFDVEWPEEFLNEVGEKLHNKFKFGSNEKISTPEEIENDEIESVED